MRCHGGRTLAVVENRVEDKPCDSIPNLPQKIQESHTQKKNPKQNDQLHLSSTLSSRLCLREHGIAIFLHVRRERDEL